MIHSFLKTIRESQIQNSKKVYVACSGGPDSTALLYLLSRCHFNFSLGVIHVNHGLRGKKSDQDEKWVRDLAKKLKLPFVSGKVNVKALAEKDRLSIEEAARGLRYQFFVKSAKRHKIDAIVLAHTMDDQAETVLMRFLSGAGLKGFGGTKAFFKMDGVSFARPFIRVTKKEILDYLKKEKIAFRTDHTNKETKFLRNRVRLDLIPYLENKFNPGIKKVLARLPEVIQSDVEFLEEESKKAYQTLAAGSKDKIVFQKKGFLELHAAIQFRLVQTSVIKLTREEFSFAHWKNFKELLDQGREFKISFAGHVQCKVSKTKIQIESAKNENTKLSEKVFASLEVNKKIKLPGSEVSILSQTVLKKPSFKKKREDYVFLDLDQVHFPLKIRYREPGDFFQPLGQKSSTKLKDFLINRKIPKEKRDSIPLVVSKNEIVWVGGVSLSECVKVTPATKRFLKLQIFS